MSDTPLADGIPGDPAEDTTGEGIVSPARPSPDDRTPEQVAHDDAVPETVPDAPGDSSQDNDAAVFVASTDPAPETAVSVSYDQSDDNVANDPGHPADVATAQLDTALDNGADTAALVKDTNDRIRNIEGVVIGFVTDVKPFIEKIEKGGIAALIGGLFGR